MTTLFEPARAGALSLLNRIVMAPLTRNRAPGAIPTPLMATYYVQRASAGLIVTEATAISHQAQGYADVPGLWSDEQVAAWKTVTDAVHAAGGRIVVQLWHVGRVSHVDLQPGGQAPVAPSALTARTKTVLIRDGVPTFADTSAPRALELSEIPGIVEDYRRAARNAIRAGLFTTGVAIGQRAKGWPDYEAQAIAAARVAGKSDDEIRQLVKSLHAKRTELLLS